MPASLLSDFRGVGSTGICSSFTTMLVPQGRWLRFGREFNRGDLDRKLAWLQPLKTKAQENGQETDRPTGTMVAEKSKTRGPDLALGGGRCGVPWSDFSGTGKRKRSDTNLWLVIFQRFQAPLHNFVETGYATNPSSTFVK